MPSQFRSSLRRCINCSGHLTNLLQQADRKLVEYHDSGLDGDRKMAIAACKSVAAQATAENHLDLAEKYDAVRAQLQG